MSQNPITGGEESTEQATSCGPVITRSGKDAEVYLYDFDKQGGAIGDIYLIGNELPKGAVITNSFMRVVEAVTGGASAEAAVTVESAGDVQASAAVSGAPWSTTGLKDTTAPEPGTESGYIVTTTRRHPKLTVSVAALTGGKVYVIVEFDVTE